MSAVRRTLTHEEHAEVLAAVEDVAGAVSHLLSTWFALDLPGDALDGYADVFGASLDEVSATLMEGEHGLRGMHVRRDLRPLREGERVRAVEEIERYPFGSIPVGAEGVVVDSTDDLLSVRFVGHEEAFAEWSGCVEWYGRVSRAASDHDDETTIDADACGYFGQTVDEGHAEVTRIVATYAEGPDGEDYNDVYHR